jgi:hypothetical protein
MYYLSNEKKSKKNFASGRWVHPTTHPDNAGLAVRGSTHTNQIGPIRCPKWVSPLEMPLKLALNSAVLMFLLHFVPVFVLWLKLGGPTLTPSILLC